jgi:hypothetical protein
VKLARFSVAPAILFGLCLGLAGGCGAKKPPGTNPHGENGDGGGGGAGASDGGGGGGSDGGGGGAVTDGGGGDGGDGGGAAAPTTCDAKVADTPALIFGDAVMLRPPIGVEFPPDDNPMTQTAQMAGGFVSACDASVKRVVVSVYQVDKKKKLGKLLDEYLAVLEKQGFTGGTKSEAYVDTATDYHLSVEYGGGGGAPPTTIYYAVARRNDKDFILAFESAPDEFKLLKPTFEASAKSILLVPQ